MPRLGLGIRLRCSVLPESIISGTAFPGETLTSTQPGQWLADGAPISGETGSTYLVRLSDIGKAIRQSRSANTLTIWKPGDIAGVARFWSSLSNVLNSVSPDVAATNGQTVRRWDGIIVGTQADQSTGINQPIYRSTGQSGNPSLEFDGSNDQLNLPGTSTVLQNVPQAYIIAGVRATNRTAGPNNQLVCYYSNNTSSTAIRLALYTRILGVNNFAAGARNLDADPFAQAASSSDSNYNVLTAHGDYSNGFVRLRQNGTVMASTALARSGNTPNNTSIAAAIGGNGAADFFPGHATCVCVVNASITATQLSQLERYIGLFGNLNIPLV